MGWDKITDTANRRSNLADINNGISEVSRVDQRLHGVVSKLASAEPIIEHLVNSNVCKSRSLAFEFMEADSKFNELRTAVDDLLKSLEKNCVEYQVPRHRRSSPQLSGSQMASYARNATYLVLEGLQEVKQACATQLPGGLEALANSPDGVAASEKATLLDLASTLRSL